MNVTKVTGNGPPVDPYNGIEFEEFLKSIGNANIKHWSILAEALGVSRRTVIRWKQHPLAQEAIKTAIAESLEGMEKSGKDDWKMHREKAKILGVKDKTTIEHEVDVETINDVLDKLGTNYDDLANKARQKVTGQMVADNPPVQNQG